LGSGKELLSSGKKGKPNGSKKNPSCNCIDMQPSVWKTQNFSPNNLTTRLHTEQADNSSLKKR
jgi:hypothetical protein